MDFGIMDLQENETITFYELPQKEKHKDPFDRMLIWQAITKNMAMISKDGSFDEYIKNGLKLVW
jgi:PIN domain nuclease of toxin-antitoxin system